jgi:hypothetical protein
MRNAASENAEEVVHPFQPLARFGSQDIAPGKYVRMP